MKLTTDRHKASCGCFATAELLVVFDRSSSMYITAVLINCTRGIVLLKLTTDRHKASCGRFATAELLVVFDRSSSMYITAVLIGQHV